MERRTLLHLGGGLLGLGLPGLGLSGCAARADLAPRRPPLRLPRVLVAPNRVIRTTVGLRPHRPSGFRLASERLDRTALIHNYGHGGAGISLSWGTGRMAAELALEHESRRAAVIGCGAVGLAAARQLQRRGFEVTIYAAAVPPDTTSNMAWAGFTPGAWAVEDSRRTPAWDAQFREAAETSFREFQWLAGKGYGVSWIDRYTLRDTEPRSRRVRPGGRGPLVPERLTTGRFPLGPGEHPFPARYAVRRSTIRIEPSIYLDALVRDFLQFGGRIRIRRFGDRRELAALDEPVVLNCTGLGALDLFDDPELMPLKGQLTVLVPQAEVDYSVSASTTGAPPGVGGLGMLPRRDGIILGSTGERGEWSLTPNTAARDHIVAGHAAIFRGMAGGGAP